MQDQAWELIIYPFPGPWESYLLTRCNISVQEPLGKDVLSRLTEGSLTELQTTIQASPILQCDKNKVKAESCPIGILYEAVSRKAAQRGLWLPAR